MIFYNSYIYSDYRLILYICGSIDLAKLFKEQLRIKKCIEYTKLAYDLLHVAYLRNVYGKREQSTHNNPFINILPNDNVVDYRRLFVEMYLQLPNNYTSIGDYKNVYIIIYLFIDRL